MIHSDLLDRIAQAGLEPHGNVMPTHLVLALRAVVKMHEPIWRGCDEPSCCGSEDMCRCGDYYPCDTIQAIEKELG
jgi:hypothetical protein